MKTRIKFELAMLHMIYVVTKLNTDANVNEMKAIQSVRYNENISDAVYRSFEASLTNENEKVIYNRGLALLRQCNNAEKQQVFENMCRWAKNELCKSKIRSMFNTLVNSNNNRSEEKFGTSMAL